MKILFIILWLLVVAGLSAMLISGCAAPEPAGLPPPMRYQGETQPAPAPLP